MNRLLLLCLALVACQKEAAKPVAAVVVDAGPAKPAKPVTLTLLFTGAENGYLLPTAGEDGQPRGGAAEVLARWVRDEGHCAGALGANGEAACADGSTVVASTGDNANGQAISSYFKGEPTAQAMHAMGYAASALGNRELDWAREQFTANAKTGGFPYLAANLRASSDEGKALGLAPMRVVERKGLKVALIGLSSHKATLTPMPGRMAGIELLSDVQALEQSVTAARSDGAGVVVVLTDGCLHELAAMLEKNPAWRVSVAAGRQCEEKWPESVGTTKLVYAGRRLQQYARVTVHADVSKAVADQFVSAEAALVDVNATNAPAPNAEVKAIVDGWKAKLDAALGSPLAFTKTGLTQESMQMSAWLTTALKEQFKADVGLINRKGVRQGLAAGAITKANVYDIIPFENEIVVVKVTGEVLLAALNNVEARYSGVTLKGEQFVDAKGAAIDAKKTYSIATPDYLFLGGDGFELHKAGVEPTATKTAWQTATIAWTEAKKSNEKKPLETLLKVK